MRRFVSIAVFLSIFAFVPLAAQDDGPNVFEVTYYKAQQGKQAAYNAAVQEYVPPLYGELVRRGHLVSYQSLVQDAGAGDFTNLLILEFADWTAINDHTQAVRDDACRTVFAGLTCGEKMAEVEQRNGERPTLRTFIRREYYTSLKP